jgi:hypothetical protein
MVETLSIWWLLVVVVVVVTSAAVVVRVDSWPGRYP